MKLKPEQVIDKAILANPDMTIASISDTLKEKYKHFAKISDSHLRHTVGYAKKRLIKDGKLKLETSIEAKQERNTEDKIKQLLKRPRSVTELCNILNCSPKAIESLIAKLKADSYNVILTDDRVELSGDLERGGTKEINLKALGNKTWKFGVVSDTHLNSKYERLDVLNALYDVFEQEGIERVFLPGNYVDGEARFNRYEIINAGITPQLKYFIEKFPQRKGIVTEFIAGDDHEGWWTQRERIDVGKYTEQLARDMGRDDLKYLGYLEADVKLKAKDGDAVMRVMHGGGGSSYALSYAPQKMIESFTSGEKPDILLLGHYHKADYLYYRGVHCVQAGCTQDQTPFMRKNKLQASIGGWIIELQQSRDGAINRFKPEWITFFDKDYYETRNFLKD